MQEQKCPKCGKPYRPGEEVCLQCGYVFSQSSGILQPGDILHERYEIQEMIHTGGMGYVYLAKDKNLFERPCIIKQVKEKIQSEDHRKKLEEEALRMAKLNHPNIAMIFDHFIEAGYYFLVVERINGKTLSEVFKERQGQLSEAEVVRWAVSICDVINYIHQQGIIHRDIAPDNIMLTQEGTIKFIDFGTLREFRNAANGGTAGMGKYGYAPPEQWQGRPEPRSDLFALGATIYYLLTGFLPLSKTFRTTETPQKEDFSPQYPPIRTRNPNVSSQLEAILLRALQLEINNRFATAVEFQQALKSLDQEATRDNYQTKTLKSKPGKSRRLMLAAIVLPLIALIGAGTYLLVHKPENTPAPMPLITVGSQGTGTPSETAQSTNSPSISPSGNSNVTTVPAGDPALAYSTSLLDFGTQGVNYSGQVPFDLWNDGGGKLSYTIDYVADGYESGMIGSSWFKISPSEGESTGERDSIFAFVDASGGQLDPGLHTGTIYISSNAGSGAISFMINIGNDAAPSSVPTASPEVQKPAHVSSGDPVLACSSNLLDFGTQENGSFGQKSFEIWNEGGGTLSYTISYEIDTYQSGMLGASWLRVSPREGESTGEHDTIYVFFDTTARDLRTGLHTGTIYISSNSGSSSVTLKFNISE